MRKYKSEDCYRCPKCYTLVTIDNLSQYADGTYSVICKKCKYSFEYVIKRFIFIISPSTIPMGE